MLMILLSSRGLPSPKPSIASAPTDVCTSTRSGCRDPAETPGSSCRLSGLPGTRVRRWTAFPARPVDRAVHSRIASQRGRRRDQRVVHRRGSDPRGSLPSATYLGRGDVHRFMSDPHAQQGGRPRADFRPGRTPNARMRADWPVRISIEGRLSWHQSRGSDISAFDIAACG